MAHITLPAAGTGDTTPQVSVLWDGGEAVQSVRAGQIRRVQVTPTITASSAYSPGYAVGGMMDFASPGRLATQGYGSIISRGLIRGLSILDRDSQNRRLELALFSQVFTASTDHTTFAIGSSDWPNLLAVIPIEEWRTFSGGSMGQTLNLAIPFVATGSDLFGQLMTWEAPTWQTTASLIVSLLVESE